MATSPLAVSHEPGSGSLSGVVLMASTGIRVLRCAHAILDVPFAIPKRQVFVVDREREPQSDAFEQRFKDLVRWWKRLKAVPRPSPTAGGHGCRN